MGRPAILEERIVRVLMPDGVELRGRDLWRAVGGGRLLGPARSTLYAALRRLELLGTVVCRDENDGPWRASPSDRIYRLSDAARSVLGALAPTERR
jgi:DNA-binding PadR family transcriptional regulator